MQYVEKVFLFQLEFITFHFELRVILYLSVIHSLKNFLWSTTESVFSLPGHEVPSFVFVGISDCKSLPCCFPSALYTQYVLSFIF